MSDDSGHGRELFDLLRSMSLPSDHFAVFGSGPLLARGIIDAVGDLDVICRGPAWDRARQLGKLVDLLKEGIRIVSTNDGAITFGTTWGYGSFDLSHLIETAEPIGGLPFVRIEHVIEYKRIALRPKDLAHLDLIDRYLKDANRQPQAAEYPPPGGSS